jgi:hypothetical protein
MPPQGLLLIAASLPPDWEVRFVDENMSPAKDEDFSWADAVLVTGMHVQRDCINDVNERAHAFGKITVLGGPSVSACAEWYPDFDILHIGELGDATRALYARLDETAARPDEQLRFTTADRTPLTDFPTPAYHRIDIKHYFRHPRRPGRPPPDPLRPRLRSRSRRVLLLCREGEQAGSRAGGVPADTGDRIETGDAPLVRAGRARRHVGLFPATRSYRS